MRPPAWSGQFVVIDWPFTDRTSSKRRPALDDEESYAHGDWHVLKVTSRRPTESALVITIYDLALRHHKTTLKLRRGHHPKIHEPLDIDEVALPITLDFWTTFGKLDATFRQEWALNTPIYQQ